MTDIIWILERRCADLHGQFHRTIYVGGESGIPKGWKVVSNLGPLLVPPHIERIAA